MIGLNQLEIIAELFPSHLLIFVLIVSQVEELLYVLQADFRLDLSEAQ